VNPILSNSVINALAKVALLLLLLLLMLLLLRCSCSPYILYTGSECEICDCALTAGRLRQRLLYLVIIDDVTA